MKNPTKEQLISFYTACLDQARNLPQDIYRGYIVPYPNTIDLVERSTNAYFVLCKEVEKVNNSWTPDFTDPNQEKWFPWFYLDNFRFVLSLFNPSYSAVSARMCFKTEELCKTFVKENLDLYKEWMLSK